MTDFPSLLYPTTSEIPTLLLVPEARRKYPFWAESPRIGYNREFPRGVDEPRGDTHM